MKSTCVHLAQCNILKVWVYYTLHQTKGTPPFFNKLFAHLSSTHQHAYTRTHAQTHTHMMTKFRRYLHVYKRSLLNLVPFIPPWGFPLCLWNGNIAISDSHIEGAYSHFSGTRVPASSPLQFPSIVLNLILILFSIKYFLC